MTYPGARRPDRPGRSSSRRSAPGGLRVGAPRMRPPILLAHGGFDFAGTFDVFAPLLADGGLPRRVAGTTAATATPSTPTSTAGRPTCATPRGARHGQRRRRCRSLGHSKGGGAHARSWPTRCPHRVSATSSTSTALPSRRRSPDVVRPRAHAAWCTSELTGWLDHRRGAGDAQRKPGTIDELAERRGRMNPRLDHDWLRYLVTRRRAARPRRLALEDRPGHALRAASGRGGPSGR